MNDTPIFGWYYDSLSNRSPSWTGVEFLFEFLIRNRSVGPFGHLSTENDLLPGDVVQLGDRYGRFYHSLLVVERYPEILIAAHSEDALYRPLTSYEYDQIRYIHIDGVRK